MRAMIMSETAKNPESCKATKRDLKGRKIWGECFIVVITNVMIIMGVHHTNCGGSSIGCYINNGQYESRSFYLKICWDFCFVWKIRFFFVTSGLGIKEKLNNHDFPSPFKRNSCYLSKNICLLKVINAILA